MGRTKRYNQTETPVMVQLGSISQSTKIHLVNTLSLTLAVTTKSAVALTQI